MPPSPPAIAVPCHSAGADASADRPDDPLLECLLALARLHGRPSQPDTLTAGLPLRASGQRLSAELAVRAAERAGLSARLVRRAVGALVPAALPAVVLLQGGDACVLLERRADGVARVLLPDAGMGERELPAETLAALAEGRVLLAAPAFRFEARTDAYAIPDPRHWFRRAFKGSRAIYAEVLVASLAINLFGLATPLFTMNVYDRVVPNRSIDTLWVLAAGVVLVIAFDTLMRVLRGWFVDVAGRRIDVALSSRIHERVLGLRLEARPPSVGGFVNGLGEFESVREFITSATVTALIDLPFVLVFVATLFAIGGPIAWIPVATIPVVLAMALVLQGPLRRTVDASQRFASQRQAALVETLVGLETIKTTASEGAAQGRWEHAVEHLARLSLRSRLLASLALNGASLIQQIAYVAVVVLGVTMIAEDRLTMGALIACTLLTGRALSPLAQVAGLAARWHQSRSALASTDRLMHLPVERPEGREFVRRETLRGAISFRGVSFAYPGREDDALRALDIEIAAGERVGIIGRTGSGKSTLEKLILGLYEPREGSILVDGMEIRQLDPALLRRSIGHVSQDVLLFYGTVRDNIKLRAPWADDAAMLRAAELGGVGRFVDASPAGYDQPVGERGELLSGGQRQAIAIARAELLEPPVLLLDEPTSAMDDRSEELFRTRLAARLAGRTLVLVTHRASLLPLVDRLIVMDKGRVVADGPRDTVLAAIASGKIHVAAD